MASFALSPALNRIVEDEARLLLEEFGAGAAIFANGQLTEARQAGKAAAVVFWVAMFEAVLLAPNDASTASAPTTPRAAERLAVQDDMVARRWSGLRRNAIHRMRQGGWQGFRTPHRG